LKLPFNSLPEFAWLSYPSLGHRFVNQLLQPFRGLLDLSQGHALPAPFKVLGAPTPGFWKNITPIDLALDQEYCWQNCRFVFASAWALQNAGLHRLTAGEIATCLAQPPWKGNLPPIFVDHLGWLYQPITDGVLAIWLQHLCQVAPAWQAVPAPRVDTLELCVPSELRFQLRYAHARCCSLLRLANREGMIALVTPESTQAPLLWQLQSPHPISWLTPDQRLVLTTPDEIGLIELLLNFPVALAAKPILWVHPQNLINSSHLADLAFPITWPVASTKVTTYLKAWVAGFDAFYRTCQIWGEVKTQQPQLAQARLGLFMIIQSLLRFLLVEVLGGEAPLEL
jgi:hypothetical protein